MSRISYRFLVPGWSAKPLVSAHDRIMGTHRRRGRFRTKAWSTGIVDVASGQLLDMVRARTAKAPTRWLLRRPRNWRAGIRCAVLDLSGPYRAAFDAALPDAKQVADPFHVVRLANDALDEVRRRVQNQTLGHRGHKHDPLYRARKLLVSASERITDDGRTKLRGLLDAGDPYGEVRDAWHAKETLRSIYDIDDAKVGAATVNQLAQDLQDPAMPPEINRLGRTIWNWRHQISNWHAARVTNAPTEAANNLVKTRQTRRLRVHQLRQLPHPGPALRRQTQLGAPRHPHSTLKREEPHLCHNAHIVLARRCHAGMFAARLRNTGSQDERGCDETCAERQVGRSGRADAEALAVGCAKQR